MKQTFLGNRLFALAALVLLCRPWWAGAATEIPIGTQTSTSIVPMMTASRIARTQVLYRADEINGAYRFNALSLYVSTIPSVKMYYFTIRMKHTGLTDLSALAWESIGWTTVYSANRTISATSWNQFAFSTPFDYDGVSNLMVDISFDNTSATTGADGRCRYSTAPEVRMMYAKGTGLGNPLTWTGTSPAATACSQYLNIKLQVAPVATPVFAPGGGTYDTIQDVIITCTTAGSVIHYTTNGVDPTEADEIIASGYSVLVDRNLTLKAKAWAATYAPSDVKSSTYTITPVATPTFTPVGGTYGSPQTVVIACATAGAEIHYTTDGNDPTLADNFIASGGSIIVDVNLTLKARAWKPNCVPSAIKSADYVLSVATPTFGPDGGTYSTPQNVTVSCATTGAVIHYTTNGIDPTEADPIIVSGTQLPFSIDQPMVLKAKAWKAGWTAGTIKSAIYSFTAATPVFSPDAGAYSEVKNVVVTCLSPGAEIHYTTNGVDPTINDPLVVSGESIPVNNNLTLRAKAWKTGWTPSAIKTAAYSFTTATPVFSPDGGTYTSFQNVTITCATPDAIIRYTTNGVDPSESSTQIASGQSVPVQQSMTLKAKAWRVPWPTSAIKSATYTLTAVATPTFSLAAGSYASPQTVTIACATSGADIHYTINGVDPTESDPVIVSGSSLAVDESMTLKAKAWKTNCVPSAVKSAVYQFTVAELTFSPDAGSYTTPKYVIVTCTSPGADIRYTLDGSDPTETSESVISGGSIPVSSNLTLKARAWRTGWTPTSIKTAAYSFVTGTPTFNPDAGTYTSYPNVTISCATPDAIIRYTTNGIDPTETSDTFNSGGTFTVNQSMTLKAKAWKDGWPASNVKTAVYTIDPVAAPVFSPSSGTYSSSQSVKITCATPGADIHYTTNGNDPVRTSPVIISGDSIVVDKNLTLKAKAWKTGCTESTITIATYQLIVTTPTFSPDVGTYTTAQDVTIACATPGVVIRYTTDGTDPTTETATIVTSGDTVTIDNPSTLKAKAWKTGWTPSSIKCAAYSFTAATPTFSPDGGSIPDVTQVTVTCASLQAEIHYTIDGSDPTEASSSVVSGSTVSVDHNLTLRAKAWKAGWTPSAIKSATYSLVTATPTFSHEGGNYAGTQYVTVTCATPSSVIRYTTNGDTPTTTDPIVASGASVAVTQSLTLKAKAWSGYPESGVKSATYTIGKAYYVKPSGQDGNDGRSWATAKLTIAAALNAATLNDQVWVAGDSAHPYMQRITLKPGVGLYGGFAGTETQLSQRNIAANETILDGEQAGTVVTVTTGTSTTRIDGFTIRNGSGSGIDCGSASPIIANNTITGNTADRGGGIYCRLSSVTIRNNIISGNTATTLGGGIYAFSDPTCTPNIANNVIAGNTANSCGGGLYCYSPAVVRHNTIIGNSSPLGGGLYCPTGPTLSNNIVAFNSSGIYTQGVPVLRNNCFYNPAGLNYTGTNAGADDITVDPHLLDRMNGDYHISSLSPCIDEGYDASVPAGSVDMDGQPRKQGAHVDIGADEAVVGASSSVIFVHKLVGDDGNDGLSWETAKLTVAGALDNAYYDDQVWVAGNSEYSYVERITLKPGVALYGGFGGIETELDQRDIYAYRTILDGDAAGSVVTVPAGVNEATRIDGFTIRNGNAESGGGINCLDKSNPTIANNTIVDNNASLGGGGIYCSASSPTITDNHITRNTAPSGGGILCVSYSAPMLTGNTISDNTATANGGGISCSSSSPSIANNTIADNTAEADGGGIDCDASAPAIWNNLILRNSASINGGGILCRNDATPESSANIVNNTIVDNQAMQGGGLYCDHSAPTVSNNIVAFNSSGVFQSWGPPILNNNCVYNPGGFNYEGMIAGTGDFSEDPLFIDRPNGNFHLPRSSHCYNGGWNDAPGLPLTDMDELDRILDGVVDVGVYEAVAHLADLDYDDDVDGDDMLMFTTCDSGPAVAPTDDCKSRDLDRDDDVDTDDFAILQRCLSGSDLEPDPDCAG